MNNEGMEFLLFPGTESYEYKNESFENRPHIISVAVSVWLWFLYHSFMLGARDPFKNIYQLPLYAKQKLRPLPLENDGECIKIIYVESYAQWLKL